MAESVSFPQNLFNSTDDLMSDGNIASGEMLSQFLDTVENSMRLIGPQLKEPVTRMETHNTCETQTSSQCVSNMNTMKEILNAESVLLYDHVNHSR